MKHLLVLVSALLALVGSSVAQTVSRTELLSTNAALVRQFAQMAVLDFGVMSNTVPGASFAGPDRSPAFKLIGGNGGKEVSAISNGVFTTQFPLTTNAASIASYLIATNYGRVDTFGFKWSNTNRTGGSVYPNAILLLSTNVLSSGETLTFSAGFHIGVGSAGVTVTLDGVSLGTVAFSDWIPNAPERGVEFTFEGHNVLSVRGDAILGTFTAPTLDAYRAQGTNWTHIGFEQFASGTNVIHLIKFHRLWYGSRGASQSQLSAQDLNRFDARFGGSISVESVNPFLAVKGQSQEWRWLIGGAPFPYLLNNPTANRNPVVFYPGTPDSFLQVSNTSVDVAGAVNATQLSAVGNVLFGTSMVASNYSTGMSLKGVAGTAGSGLTVLTNGNAGFGTNNPQTALHVLSSSPSGIITRLDDTNGTRRFQFGVLSSQAYAHLTMGNIAADGVGNYVLASDGSSLVNLNGPLSSTPVNIAQAGTARLTVAGTTGNVGIGTTTPLAKQHTSNAVAATVGLRVDQNSTNNAIEIYNGNTRIFWLTTNGAVNGVKVYVALLYQDGINDPVATILQNTLGGVPVWVRNAEGDYKITLAGAFPLQKFVVFTGSSSNPDGMRYSEGSADADHLNFIAVSDGATQDLAVEIRVYP